MKYSFTLAFLLFLGKVWATPTNPIIKITPNSSSPFAVTQTLPAGTIHTQRLCTGQQIKLEAISSGTGALTYEWLNVQTGVIGTSSTFIGNLPEGQYQVKITDGTGTITSTTLITICLESAPPINAALTSNGALTICTVGSLPDIILTATGSNPAGSVFCPNPAFTYKWFKDNILITGATGNTFNIGQQAINAGVYTVQITNSCGFASASITISTTNAAPLEASIFTDDASNLICPSGSITLRATAIGVVDSYEWYSVGNSSPLGSGNSFNTTQIGTYYVKVKNGCGEKQSANFVVVNSIPPTQVNLSGSPANFALCTDRKVIFSPTGLAGGSPTLIEYFKDDVLVYSISTPFPNGLSYQTAQAGTYKVKISNKCGSVTSTSKTVAPNNGATKGKLNLNGISPSLGCGVTELNLSFQANGTNLGVQWYQGTDPLAGENNPTLLVNSAGFYFAEVYSSCGGFYSDTLEVMDITDPPLANLTLTSGGITTCEGKIKLTSTDAGAGCAYKWFKNTLLVATTAQNEYEALETGSYTVQAVNACGSSTISNALNLTVKKKANKPTIEAPAGKTLCSATGNILLRLTSIFEVGIDYQWFKNGLPIAGANTDIYTATESGTYTLRAINPANDCPAEFSDALEVRFVVAPTTANTFISLNICESPIVLRSVSDGNFLQYRWFWLDGITNPQMSNNATFTPTANGTYTLSVRNDCLPAGVWITTAAVTVNVGSGGNLPAPTVVSEPAGIDRICPNTTLKLKAQTTGSIPNIAYRWFLGNDMIAGATNAEVTVSNSGLYRVEIYSLQNPACGQISTPYSIFVRPKPTILISYTPSLTFCEGDSIRLNANAQQIPATFGWSLGGTFIQNSNQLYAKKGGKYEVKATYNAGTLSFPCDYQTTQEINATMLASPVPEIINKGGLLEAKGKAESYQWNYEGVPILGANSPFFMPLDSGRYSLTVTNDLGCSGTSNALSHAGIYEGKTNPLQIAPNPNNGSFSITVVGAEAEASVAVYNAQGQLLQPSSPALRLNSLASHTKMEFKNLPKGIYLVHATIGSAQYTRRVVVL